jgi:hypothetical protein
MKTAVFWVVISKSLIASIFTIDEYSKRLPLSSGGQSSWMQIQRSRDRFPALPEYLSCSGSGTESLSLLKMNEEVLE